MSNDITSVPGQSGRIAALRESIRKAFPAETYQGKVTDYDDKLDDPELDEERELFEALNGRRWTDIPQQLLENKPDGYGRLSAKALQRLLRRGSCDH